jgi:hypothetical protein
MRPENFDVQQLISELRGSVDSIDDRLPDGMGFEDLTTEDTQAIDSEIFCCEQCGWWCEVADQSENNDAICVDCCEDNDDI